MQYFSREGLDHAPIHVSCNSTAQNIKKIVLFLNFWCNHKEFKALVRTSSKVDFSRCPFIEFNAKLNKTKTALEEWSNRVFGNIFIQIATLEDNIRVKEAQLEILPSPEN